MLVGFAAGKSLLVTEAANKPPVLNTIRNIATTAPLVRGGAVMVIMEIDGDMNPSQKNTSRVKNTVTNK